MSAFTPTLEQAAIIAAARDTTANLAVIARAGAAKTSTLVMIAEALPKTSILCLAFNKKIADEMSQRLPANCEAKTLHGLGYKAWWGFIRTACKVDDRKVFALLKDEIDSLTGEDKTEAYESLSETLDFIKKGKAAGWLPETFKGHWKPLFTDEEFFESLPMEPTLLQISLISKVSIESWKLALKGQLDFDDMILCPAICQVSWPAPPLTLIDEAQDLSPLNHHILKKIVKNRRIIAVGDPCQPLGTMITKVITKGDRWNPPTLKQVAIEDIKEGDTVLGHNANGSFMFNRRVKGITRKSFEGNLVVVGPTKYTPNHHCYTRFAALADHWCIYLMKKGEAYRIGKARMSYGEQGLGPQIRAKAEEADAMWILSTYAHEEEAYIAEAVIQTEFGLSDLCFIDPNRPWLSSFWKEMETLNMKDRAIACLGAYHREYEYPLWRKGDSIPAKRPFITRACNLLDGGELLPYNGDKATGKDSWQQFSVSHEPYSGDVISFTISDNHLYVADGIVTHNCQAIYGFRGADVHSMPNLIKMFSMEELRLTISFRCGRKITENARWLAKDMKSPAWAIDGEVRRPEGWTAAEILPGDAIICRNNAPLFAMAIKMIEHGQLPELAGRDLAGPLKKIMKTLGKPNLLRAAAVDALHQWRDKEMRRAREGARGNIEDKFSCLRVILEKTKTLGDAEAYLEHLLTREGRVYLMTGHKSKGLEFERVWFLDPGLCRIERDQDANIKYVIETRAKAFLSYVSSSTFEDGEEE